MFLVFATVSCERKSEGNVQEVNYRDKADELLGQIITERSSTCIEELPELSVRQSSKAENANSKIDDELISCLGLSSLEQLDSLDKLSVGYRIDAAFVKKYKVRVLDADLVRKQFKGKSDTDVFEGCENEVLFLSKPIFDKTFTKAIIENTLGSCIPMHPDMYVFRDGVWVLVW